MEEGGRLAVISYHSLEDRLVKHFMRSGNFEDDVKRDLKGAALCPFAPLNRKAVVADEEEQPATPDRAALACGWLPEPPCPWTRSILWPHEEVVLLPPQTEGQAKFRPAQPRTDGCGNRRSRGAKTQAGGTASQSGFPQKAQRTAKATKPRNRILTEGESATTGARPTRTRWFNAASNAAHKSVPRAAPRIRSAPLFGTSKRRIPDPRRCDPPHPLPHLRERPVHRYIAMGYQFERLEREKLQTKRQLEELSASTRPSRPN